MFHSVFLPLIVPVARPADAHASTFVDVEIVSAQWVPVLAVRLLCSPCPWACASCDNIRPLPYWLKVCRIYTRGIATQMVKNHSVRDRANFKFIGDAVRGRKMFSPLHMAVAGRPACTIPCPTVGGFSAVYLRPKASDHFGCRIACHDVNWRVIARERIFHCDSFHAVRRLPSC